MPIYLRDAEVEALRRARISATLKGRESLLRGRPRSISEKALQEISESFVGAGNPNFKGYHYRDGYVIVYVGPGPTYRKRADLIMEEILGRLLLPGEIVSHKNLIRDDDRRENLELFPGKSEHSRHHAKAGDLFGGWQKSGRRIR